MKKINPIQLTGDQIKELFAYTERMHIGFKDIQCEIVDHIASGVEDTMNKNTDLTFSKALYEYTGTLPMRFFNDLIEEKTKTLEGYWENKFIFSLSRFITFPSLLITILIYITYYNILKILGPGYFEYFMYSLTIAMLIFTFYKRELKFNHTHHKYLIIKSWQKAIFPIFVFLFIIPLYISFVYGQSLLDYKFGNEINSLTLTSVTLLIYFGKFVFSKMLKTEIESKYSHLKIKLF